MSRRLSQAKLKAALAAIDKEPGSANDKLVRRMRLTHGRDVLSRRAFMETSLCVQDKRTGVVGPWWLNSPQRMTESIRLRTVRAGKLERYATLKARKWGISTLWLGFGIEAAVREPNFLGGIVADNKDAAATLLQQGRIMRDAMPFKLKKKWDNRSLIYFESPLNSCLEIASAKAKDPGRGRTWRFVHITEPQLWTDAAAKLASIENTVPDRPGTLISYEGTGFGRNWWYEFWWAARRGESDYTAIFFSWIMDKAFDYQVDVNPEEIEQLVKTMTLAESVLREHGASWGQIMWRRKKIATSFSGDERMFMQEFPLTPEEAFLSDGRPAFLEAAVDAAIDGCSDPIWKGELLLGEIRTGNRSGVEFRVQEDPKGRVLVWEHPAPGHEYSIGSDSGQGIGADNSAAYVIDNHTKRMVASFVDNHIEPRPFGYMLSALAEYYNLAYVLPEIEGPGGATLDSLKEVGYPKIGVRYTYDTRGKVVGNRQGWSTNIKSRPIMFNEGRAQLSDPAGATILDKTLCLEMRTMYRDPDGTEKCPEGKKDDRVIAWLVTLMACRESSNPVVEEEDYRYPKDSLEGRHWARFEKSVRVPQDDEEEFSDAY